MLSLLSLTTLGPLVALVVGTVALKGRPLHWLLDLVEWLFERPVRALVLFLTIVAVLGWWRAHDIDQARDELRLAVKGERDAHGETKARVAAAAKGAADLAEFNRAAIEAEWRGQYQEALHANDTLRDRNRALLAQWLHAQPGRTNPRGAGGADLPGAPALPSGTVYDAETAVVPVADLVDVAAAYAQLESLIGFVTAATAVETSPPAPGAP
jgi:hypothetical protein